MVTVVRERLLLLRDVRPPVLLRVLFLFAAAASAQDFAASDYEGRTIGRIEFDPPHQPFPRSELGRMLPCHTGSMAKLAEVRAGIQKLSQTGRFSDVSIEAQLEGDAVALLISTQLN